MQSNVYIAKDTICIALHLRCNYSSMFIYCGQWFYLVPIWYLLFIIDIVVDSSKSISRWIRHLEYPKFLINWDSREARKIFSLIYFFT